MPRSAGPGPRCALSRVLYTPCRERIPLRRSSWSERELRAHLDIARIAAPHLVKLSEQRVARGEVVGYSRTVERIDGVHATGSELRMVEGVEEVSAYLESHALTDGDVLGE